MMQKRLNKISVLPVLLLLVFCFITVTVAAASVDSAQAVAIGKENISRLTNQSYHYRIEFDTVLCLPVYSKFINRDDFYLLYFLKNNSFQAEVEVDKENGEATLLSYGTMSQPYMPKYDLSFNYSLFNPDSILTLFRKQRPIKDIDSIRLVYFGVIPDLGKRGVIWEIFAFNGPYYFSFLGKQIKLEELIKDVNLKKTEFGNPTADSIRIIELEKEIARLNNLTDDDLQKFPDLTRERIDSLVAQYHEEISLLENRNSFRWPGRH
jgi:hypothetical protein